MSWIIPQFMMMMQGSGVTPPGGIELGNGLWFDATKTDSLTLNAQDQVTAWQTSGGQSVSITPQTGQEPRWRPNMISRNAAVYFDGSESLSSAIASIEPKEIHVMLRNDNAGTLDRVLSFGDTQNDTQLLGSTVAAESYKLETAGGGGVFPTDKTLASDEPQYLTTIIDGASSKLSFNTLDVATGTLVNIASTQFTAGAGFNLFDQFTGLQAEIIVYDRVLTAAEREAINSYFVNKYFSYADKIGGKLDLDSNANANYLMTDDYWYDDKILPRLNLPTYGFTPSPSEETAIKADIQSYIDNGGLPDFWLDARSISPDYLTDSDVQPINFGTQNVTLTYNDFSNAEKFSVDGGIQVIDTFNTNLATSRINSNFQVVDETITLAYWTNLNAQTGADGYAIGSDTLGGLSAPRHAGSTLRAARHDLTLVGIFNYDSTPNVWTHLAFTYNLVTKEYRAYQNGVEILPVSAGSGGTINVNGRLETTGSFIAGNLLLGNNSALSQKFNGKISTVIAVKKLYSNSDILQLFNSQKSRFGL